MNPPAYIVEGRTGTFDDTVYWIYGIFLNEDSARKTVDDFNDKLNKLGIYLTLTSINDPDGEKEKAFKEYSQDKNFQVDFNGAHYFYYTSEIRDAKEH